jgi:hypothetical protein
MATVPAPRGRQDPSLAPVEGGAAGATAVGCGRDHGRVGGTLDETARRLTHEELAVALQLASEGHHVRSLATRRGRGRTPDLLVCGAPVEVKSWLGMEERAGPPGARSVVNKLIQAEGQAAVVVLNGRGTGLRASDVDAGMRIYSRLPRRANVAAVRVLGDSFDLAWARQPSLGRDRHGPVDRDRWRRPEPGMSL